MAIHAFVDPRNKSAGDGIKFQQARLVDAWSVKRH
jgi:hypothetical protein